MIQVEFRLDSLWPEGGRFAIALSLMQPGRSERMGVDPHLDPEQVGAFAAFCVQGAARADGIYGLDGADSRIISHLLSEYWYKLWCRMVFAKNYVE